MSKMSKIIITVAATDVGTGKSTIAQEIANTLADAGFPILLEIAEHAPRSETDHHNAMQAVCDTGIEIEINEDILRRES